MRKKRGAFLLRGGEAGSIQIALLAVEGGESAVNEVDAAGLFGTGRSVVGGDDLGGEGSDFTGVGGLK